ncbi:hypothetical protein C0992_004638 [Termitomyces sp. T32_za158]|nr:hypothetical protein C0992_004638 [Termitomyces sp. T32_za158]
MVIPNYPDLKTFQERVDKWHCHNPNNTATATLTGNTNPDADQALQQQLIQEILPTVQPTIQPTTIHATLTWQEMINNLEQRLQALKNQTFDGVEICQPKQASKGYRPIASITGPAAVAPAATAPAPATTSTTPEAPAPNTAMPAASTNQPAPAQLPLHPYSGILNRYALLAQKNFAAPDKRQEGPYQLMAPVYNIEKSNQVFSRIMKSAITLLVEELCSIAPNVRNQMKMAVTPKRTMQAAVQDTNNIDNALPGFALFALPPNADNLVAKATSVDPVKTYFKLLAPEDDCTILTIAQDSQAIRSIMLTVDNKSEVEAIVDSGSQIISMSADVANELSIIYNPAIHLNMQSANSTINRSLGLAKNEVISNNHGDEALISDYNHQTGSVHITATADLDPEVLSPSPTTSANTHSQNTSLTDSALAYLYLTASDNFDKYSLDDTYLTTLPDSSCPAALGLTKARNCTSDMSNNLSSYVTAPKQKGVQVKKKYKPVALKTKPVASSVSKDFRIEQKIIGNPLADMPPLTPNPPPFVLTGRFTNKRRKQFLANHNKGFLTAAKLNVLTNLMAKQNKAFAWEDSECGSLRTNFFLPIVIPTIPHIP